MTKAKAKPAAQFDRELEQQAQYGPAFHVLAEWPDARQPLLILIHAKDAIEARRVVENDIRGSGGKVMKVDLA